MIKRVAGGVVAGACGATLLALGEPLLGRRGSYAVSVGISAGLLLPASVFFGALLVMIQLMLPPGYRMAEMLRAMRSRDDANAAGRVLATGLWSLMLFPASYRLVYSFLTTFHHLGLTALSVVVVFAALALGAALFGARLVKWVVFLLRQAPAQLLVLRRPAVALAFVLSCWTAAIAPPLWAGPRAKGLFGFMGLLRRDGIRYGPFVSLAIMAVVAAVVSYTLSNSCKFRWVSRTAVLCILVSLCGPVFSNHLFARDLTMAEHIETTGGLAESLAKTARSFGDADGDGYSRWMGGRDCNDHNRMIHPNASDLPNNGIDEDCSGGDLKLEVTKNSAERAKLSPQVLQRPPLPDDVSLLLITIDALRQDSPGFMGNHNGTTPNLDALVARGATVYDRAYSLGSYTGQSVSAMMTGKYPSEMLRNDRHETRISLKELLAAESVCSETVRCGAVLSHFLFEPYFGWHQGFHDWKIVADEPPGPGHSSNKYNSPNVTAEAIRWLKNPENTKGRFWLWTHYIDPHKEYLLHPGFGLFGNSPRDMYDHEILFTDYHVGRLLDFLATLPAAKRTVIIVTSDHGEQFGEHGEWGHGWELWEEIIRVPWVVAGPGIAIKRIARPTSHIDLYPTILDLFGAPLPKAVHGKSVLPDWVQGQQLPERSVVADQARNPYYHARRAFIKDGWKLYHSPDTGSFRLFRLSDGNETKSLVLTEPAQFAAIKAAYQAFLAKEFNPIPPVQYSGAELSQMPSH